MKSVGQSDGGSSILNKIMKMVTTLLFLSLVAVTSVCSGDTNASVCIEKAPKHQEGFTDADYAQHIMKLAYLSLEDHALSWPDATERVPPKVN